MTRAPIPALNQSEVAAGHEPSAARASALSMALRIRLELPDALVAQFNPALDTPLESEPPIEQWNITTIELNG